MNNMTEQKLKKSQLKLKTQLKQLQVVQALISRSSGYAKTQAEASEKRLEKEIIEIQKEIKSLQGKQTDPVGMNQQKQEIVIKNTERTAFVAVKEEIVACNEPYTNLFEKELKKVLKESNYSNVSLIYRKFYKESAEPEKIETIFSKV